MKVVTVEQDDLGADVSVPAAGATRLVSLVPSLTEAIAATRRTALVGCTDWCTHPADLDVERLRGTKNPDVKRIVALAPDLVVVNQEENRQLDVRRLRDAGVAVWVTVIEDVPAALASMRRLFTVALGWGEPAWLASCAAAWSGLVPPVTRRVAVPVWRDPWMVVGRSTFTGDLLRRLGWANVFDDSPDRYPSVTVAGIEAAGPDVVLLPSEPYEFTVTDGPEAFTVPTELVDGRLITWYGPSLLEARSLLRPDP